MRNNLFMGVAIAALAIPAAAVAQQITTGIEGTVADTGGQPIAGAQVVITDTRTGNSRTLTTGNDGLFRVDGLVTGGPYTAVASASGFDSDTVADITTSLQGNTNIAFSLAAAGEQVVVTGTRNRAQVTQLNTGPGTSFGTEVLENAPSFNRDVRDIIRIDPRVSLDRDDGGSGQDRVSCLGGNDRTNTFTVDGIIQADIYGLNDTPFASRSSIPIPFDAIRETQVNFAPFDVEYGQFTGCSINVVTKSGSNAFHGSGFYEYTGKSLLGDNVAGIPVNNDGFKDERYGATLGGPLIKDRLFFFGGYERRKSTDIQDDGPSGGGFTNETSGITLANFNTFSEILGRVYGIQTGGLARTLKFDNKRYFGRLDWYINDKHRLEATYQRLEEASVRPDDFFATGASQQIAGLNTFYKSGTTSDYYSGRLYSQWNDRFSTELRYSHARVIDAQDPVGGGEAQDDNPIPRIIVGIVNGTQRSAILAGPGISRSANDLQTKVDQYKAKASLTAGAHTLTAGFELNRADIFNLFVQNATGTLVFENFADFEQGLLSRGLGNNQTSTTGANVTNGQTEGAFGNFSANGDINSAAAAFKRSIWSVYAQDNWRLSDQVSVVLGLRTDWYSGDRPRANPNFQNRYAFSNAVGFSTLEPIVMPRVSFTYTPSDFAIFSRTSLKGGVGIFSGGDPAVWFGNAFQNNGFLTAQGTSQAAGCGVARIDVVTGGTFTGVPACVVAAGSAVAAAGQGNVQSIDPHLKAPTVLRANVGLQTRFGVGKGFFNNWNLSLDYIYSHYRDPLSLVDLAQTIDIRRGLNGFTVDGRPIYAAIDPTLAGCTARLQDQGGSPPVFTGVTAACFNTTTRFDELQLTNQKSFNSQIASVILSKSVNRGLFTKGGSMYFSAGYAFTDANDRRNMYNSTAGSNYDQSAAFDRQNPEPSHGFFASRHNFSVSGSLAEDLLGDGLETRFGFTFVARAGRPYSLTFGGQGVVGNTNSGADNALLYVPTGVNDPNVVYTDTVVGGVVTVSGAQKAAALDSYINGLKCAREARGRTISRNSCTNPWFYDLDLSFSQDLPGPGRWFGKANDTIKLYATFDNFLNFLDKDKNIFRRRQFAGLINVADLNSIDTQGRYVVSNFFVDEQLGIQTSSSLWRLKVGVSYDF